MANIFDEFNGRSFFLGDTWLNSYCLQLYTDPLPGFGFRAILGKLWCFGPWPEHWKIFNIVILEFYPTVLSVLLWGPLMRNQRILFYTDNAALVDIINKTTSHDSTRRVLVRQLVPAFLNFNIFSHA